MPSLTVASCAASVGTEWYQTRAADTVSEFLAMDGVTLIRYPTFGRVKVRTLIEIVSSALGVKPDADHVMDKEADELFGTTADPTITSAFEFRPSRECLSEMCVPDELPLELVRLPVRIQHYCDENHLKTLGDLLDAWESLGEAYFINLPNLGKKSVGMVRTFYQYIQRGDTAAISTWLPMATNGVGLSLAKGLADATMALPNHQRVLLVNRLVHGQTLEEAAAEFALTRERTRQVETKLLKKVENLLEWFPEYREEMLSDWMQGKSCLKRLENDVPETEQELLLAALERVFSERPEGVARELEVEARLERWQVLLKEHSDLLVTGVDLEEFMKTEVPVEYREAFCLSLDGRGRIRLDHQTGRVVHTGPRLSEVVKAILAREDDPIPLTWLHELVLQTPTHPHVEREQIYRYRIQWKSDDPDFPRDKVLWHQ